MYEFFVILLEPFTIMSLFAAGVALPLAFGRARRLYQRAAGFLLLLLVLLHTPLAGHLAMSTLERQYDSPSVLPESVQTVVVLGGYVRKQKGETCCLAEDCVYRTLEAARLYHGSSEKCLVVASGGTTSSNRQQSVADAMRDFLIELGVDGKDIVVEDESTSTYENAVRTADLLRARGITKVALVTDASHLPRAVRCFEKQGILIVPVGCRYGVGSTHAWNAHSLIPQAWVVMQIRRATHEWLGIGLYWMHGRI